MEQMQRLVLQLILQLVQFLFITIQVQKVDIHCVNVGEHLRRKQTTQEELGGGTEGAEYVKKKKNKFIRAQKQQKLGKVLEQGCKFF